jgi:hypothetical protein
MSSFSNKIHVMNEVNQKIGIFDDPKKKLIAFFHEIGHFIFRRDYIKDFPLSRYEKDEEEIDIIRNNILIDEFMASVCGLKFAEEKGFFFSKEEQNWLFERFCSYSKDNVFWKCSQE